MRESKVKAEFIEGTEFTMSAYDIIHQLPNLHNNASVISQSTNSSRTDTALESSFSGEIPSAERVHPNASENIIEPFKHSHAFSHKNAFDSSGFFQRSDTTRPSLSGRSSHAIPKASHSSKDSALVLDSVVGSQDLATSAVAFMNESCVSFSDVLSSTPLPQYGDPRNLKPLDLSLSRIEESPLDYSMHEDVDGPLNLVMKSSQAQCPIPKIEQALNFICREKRSPEKGSFSSSAKGQAQANFTGPNYSHHSQKDYTAPKPRPSMSGTKRRLSLFQLDSNSTHLIPSKRNESNREIDNQHDKENSLLRVTEYCLHDDNEEDDKDDEDGDDGVQGDATFLNDFSIFEYFEPYRNQSVADEDDLKNNATNHDEFDEMGFAQLERDAANDETRANVMKKLTSKKMKEKGLEYIRTNGITVPARKVQQTCNCMKRKCHEKFSDELREKLLKNLLLLTLSGQNQFLSNHVTVTYVHRHRVVNSRRVFTYKYYLPGDGGQIRVCLKMFLNTFNVTEKKIRVLVSKKVIGMGIAADDRRLLNTNRCPISSEAKTYIEDHIKSFPAYFSHYTRENTAKKYLSSDLNIAKMYELYVSKCNAEGRNPVHYNSYRIIFNGFNLGFRKPKADTCNECDRLKILIKVGDEGEKIQAEEHLRTHQAHAKSIYDCKKQDVTEAKTNQTTRTVSFDLQKCLATPYLRNGHAFYKRQLYTYNLTIFETHRGKNRGLCYMWDESRGRRGANEIGSCLLADLTGFLNENVNAKLINLYSDRCGGQNLNFIICMTFSYIVEQCNKDGRDVTVRHKFMCSGHSHMEVDSIHGSIERAKKITSVDIDTPRDWVIFIGQIRRKTPLVVRDLEQRQLLSLKSLSSRYKKPRLNSVGQQIKFKQVAMFEYRSTCPGIVYYKTDLASDEYFHFRICDTETVDGVPLPLLKPSETEPIPLPYEKLQDLKQLMPYVGNKTYYEAMLKSLVVPKRGRKAKSDVEEENFDDDVDKEIDED
ncbi:uncharacterized protein LOC134219336 [Armigeres subalbatus]|uniref:uncharacterized protein LOC134219336 n=1 Tax=Armigeres subalbatus TaxID=124917 RepID=UPI002ED2FFC2